MESFTDIQYILNGFLFVFSGVLVMWMATGFAMLEAGLTRTKNTATILTKNVTLFALACIVYYFVGYNVMYGEGGAFMGSFGPATMSGGDSYPLSTDFFFQAMFVATAASVISGSVAERMKMWPFFIFVVILSAFIYPIQGHWTWGGSLTGEGGLIEGFSDFAGSTIVHSVGGWAALAAVIILGARKGKYGPNGEVRAITGSNMPLATL
ncbi:MAG: ammonium transporter, partial [Campylobacterales bacterium]|nr:ammonium transporter [Campylobacterales bacterium]